MYWFKCKKCGTVINIKWTIFRLAQLVGLLVGIIALYCEVLTLRCLSVLGVGEGGVIAIMAVIVAGLVAVSVMFYVQYVVVMKYGISGKLVART